MQLISLWQSDLLRDQLTTPYLLSTFRNLTYLDYHSSEVQAAMGSTRTDAGPAGEGGTAEVERKGEQQAENSALWEGSQACSRVDTFFDDMT
jgi:hypothetical protein